MGAISSAFECSYRSAGFWFLLLNLGIGCSVCPQAAANRNVVLFIADDLSQVAGCYGNANIRTPNIDSLAAEGTLYSHAFCATASCSPSRAVIMTGLHSHANGQLGLAHGEHNFHSLPTIETLPALMAKAGYRTARIGRSVHVRPRELYEFGLTLPPSDSPLTRSKRLYGRNVMQCVQDARKFIEADDQRPFFLMFCTADAHRFGTTFPEKDGQPNSFANDHEYERVSKVTYSPEDVSVPAFLNDDLATRAELAEYYQAVSRVDQGVGALVSTLKATNNWHDTLFVFISDHGMPFPGAKTTLYEPGIRSPCIVYAPATDTRGVVSDAMISWVDVAPTILDFADAPSSDASSHGRSFLSTIGHSHVDGWDEVFASHTFHEVTMYYPMRMVRTRQYKLIRNIAWELEFPTAADLRDSATWRSAVADQKLGKRSLEEYLHRPEYELYDLQNDPNECNNLAEQSRYAEVLDDLRNKLSTFQQVTNDPWPSDLMHE